MKKRDKNSVQTANSTAWLESIELENVRCFHERQIVPFTTTDGKKAQWTLLLGENGTGKSTLLQVCAMLMPRRWETYEGKYSARSHLHDSESLVWGRLLRAHLSQKDAARIALSLEIGNREVRWEWHIRIAGGALGVGQKQPIPSFDERPTVPLCLAYAPYRSPRSFIPEDTGSIDMRGLFLGFTRLRHPSDWYKDYTLATVNPSSDEKSRTRATAILDRIRKTLRSVLPDVNDLRIDTELEGGVANRLHAQTPYGWVDIDSLGFGYQSILALVVDIASRLVEHYPKSTNPLAEPAVILIDEVDLHLHPKWQRTLQQELSEQFPNAQFIATAHSPLVVQSSPSANVLLLKRDGDHVIIERAPDVVKTWRVDQILTSDLVFGLPTARPPHLDAVIGERDEILGKSELTAADENRLEELRKQIETTPGGESRWEMQAAELIREASLELKPAAKKATKRPAKKKQGRA